MAETLRAFIAVPIPDRLSAFLQEAQARLRTKRSTVRWVPVRNIHLTLKFLGDIDPSQVPEISGRMDAAAATLPPFELNAGGVGVFPNLRQARVVWIGLAGDIERLRQLRAALESGLAACGFDMDTRPYRAHLTIGRTRQRMPAAQAADLLASPEDPVSDSFRVDRVILYRSILKPSGAEYRQLHASSLTGGSANDRRVLRTDDPEAGS
ncbi:MAG TPA: RNA 2',3'-cyclic phosphodiesterase [Desulfosarcina sp.]|nr:RNA 2',3'-cyclic phosphodiesterase [Desulfosarcina sp.]